MAEKAGVSVEDYKIVRRGHHDLHQGAEPRRVRAGHAPRRTSTTRPSQIADFLVSTGLAPAKPVAGRPVRAEVRQGPAHDLECATCATDTRAVSALRTGGVVGAAAAPATPAAAGRSSRCACRSRRRARWSLMALSIVVPLAAWWAAERQRRRASRRTTCRRRRRHLRRDWRWPVRVSCSIDALASVQRVFLGLRPGRGHLGAARASSWAASPPAGRSSNRSSGCCATCRPARSSRCSSSGSASGGAEGRAHLPRHVLLQHSDDRRCGPWRAARAHRRLVHAGRPNRRGDPQGDHPALAARHDRRGPGQRGRGVELRRGRRAHRAGVGPRLPDQPARAGSPRSTRSSRCSS